MSWKIDIWLPRGEKVRGFRHQNDLLVLFQNFLVEAIVEEYHQIDNILLLPLFNTSKQFKNDVLPINRLFFLIQQQTTHMQFNRWAQIDKNTKLMS